MYENATHLQFSAETLNKGLKILRSQVVPILKAQSGLLSLALIPNRETNQVTVLSIWTTAAAARLVEIRPEYRQVVKLLDPLIVSNNLRASPRPLTLVPAREWPLN